MDHLILADLVVPGLEVRKLESPDPLYRRIEGFAGASTSSLAVVGPSQPTERFQNLGSVEPLAATVLAEAHSSIMPHREELSYNLVRGSGSGRPLEVST